MPGPGEPRGITGAFNRLGQPTPGAGSPKRAGGGLSSGRSKVLVAGAAVLGVVAIGGVIVVPRLVGPSDPGCKAYTSTAIGAYNKTINDLNAQASQTTLTGDMSTAISDLTSAVAQSKSATVKSALQGVLDDLKTVQSDVRSGSVPVNTVDQLNAAATDADNAC